MPDLTGQASTFRGSKHRFQGYIGTLPQTVVHSGSLSATPTFPATAISITTSGGTSANVKRGMTIKITSSGGTLKGYCRVATSGTISNSSIPVNETSKGVVNLASGDLFSVYDGFRIWDMLVSATSALNKDSRITYTDQGANPDPIANAGGGFFGFTDDGQTYATVSFPGTSSLNVDPDSASKTYLWSVGDGTITVGTTTTGDITATFPVGFRHVQLIVTDANGKTTTRQFPVRVYNRSTTRPLTVARATLNYSEEDGWAAQFELPKGSESGITTLPDGALICFFADEYYGSTRASYRSNVSGRSHMLFIGYLVRNTVSINALNNTVTFEALSPLGMLNKTPALPQLMVQNSGTGSLWRHVKTLNTNRMAWYLIRYGATAMGTHDFVWQLTGSALSYRRIAVTETSSIGAQLRDIAQSVNLKVTCDMLGRILLIQDFNYLSSANRSSRTVVFNFTMQDIREFEFTNEHRGTVKFVRGEGITDGVTASSNRPCFSNSPGNAPSPFGTSSDTLTRQIVDNQTDLNTRTGFHFARVNGLYDGQFVPQGARLRLFSPYAVIDPAYNEPFTITLPATSNRRGVSFSTSTRWTAASASLTFDGENGTIDPVYTIDHETTGQAGTTYIKPQASQNGLPDYTPISLAMPVITLPTTTQPLARGTGNIAAFHFGSKLLTITSDFNTPSYAGGPTVTNVTLSALSGNIVTAIGNPFSPLYLGTGSTVNGWIATTSGLYTIDDIFGARTLTLRLTFTSSIPGEFRRVLAVERAVQNFAICASYYAGSGVYIARTTDGITWSEAQLTAHYNSTTTDPPHNRTPTAWVSAKIPGRCYAFAFTATGAGQAATNALFKSDDYGATWTQTSYATNAQSLGYCLHFPWHDNDNDRYFLWTKTDTGSTITLMRSDTVLGTQTVINPLAGLGQKAGTSANPFAIDSSVLDRRSLVISGARIAGSAYGIGVYTSRDFGDSWVTAQPEITALSNRIQSVRFAPNSKYEFYTLGEDSYGVGYSSDYGLYVDPRMSSATNCIALVGG